MPCLIVSSADRQPADTGHFRSAESPHDAPDREPPRRLAAEALESRDVPSAYDLGDAAAFNALFFSDMTAMNSDAEGRVAVGGHGTFSA